MAAPATRMLVAWRPDWPVVAAGVRSTEPAAVVDAGRVVACSAAARAEGVRRGHRRRQAEACCPGLAFLAHDPARDARAFEPVVASLEAFTPAVEVIRPGVAAFATRGPSRYFGGDEALAARVAASVEGVRTGIADGRFAAELAARRRTIRESVPESGTDSLIVPPGGSAAFLAPFPVGVLGGCDAELPGLLVRLGIRTVDQFAALPAKAVLARFGAPGAAAHRLARGLDGRPLAARTPPPDLAVTAELDPPADRVETATFVARALAARLHEALATRGLALVAVRIDAETEHGECRSRLWRLDGGGPAAGGAPALAERARWQLEAWLTSLDQPTGPITALRLAPEEVRPDGGRQAGFWGGDRAAAERVARALERLQGRFGAEAVTTAVVAGGRGPADQARLVPWGAERGAERGADRSDGYDGYDGYQGAAQPWPGRAPAPAPATVLPEPMPARVTDAEGAAVEVSGRGAPSAAPALVSVGGRRPAPVTAWAGPWPVDERWWDPDDHRRCARWQVVTAGGDAYLLRLENGRWLVEAEYD